MSENCAASPRITVFPDTLNRFTATPIAEKRKRRVAAYARVSTNSDEQKTNIYGDVHIHCDCCDECGSCGEYAESFEEALESSYEAAPDAEDGAEIRLSAEEAEDVVKAVARLLLPFLSAEIEE